MPKGYTYDFKSKIQFNLSLKHQNEIMFNRTKTIQDTYNLHHKLVFLSLKIILVLDKKAIF